MAKRQIHVRLPSELVNKLDEYVRRQRPRTSRNAVVEMIIEHFLGSWTPANRQDGDGQNLEV